MGAFFSSSTGLYGDGAGGEAFLSSAYVTYTFRSGEGFLPLSETYAKVDESEVIEI